MKRKTVIFLPLFLATFLSHAQLEYSNWVMSQSTELDFKETPPLVTRTNPMSMSGNASVYSNPQGELVFFGSGERIYNADLSVMDGGVGLFSSSQPASASLVVPHPVDDSTFYVFGTSANGEFGGLVYQIVEPYFYGEGKGKVTTNNVQLMEFCAEKLIAIRKSTEPGFWVISHELGNNVYRVFEVTPFGVRQPADSIAYQAIGNDFGTESVYILGQIKFSPDGTMMASVNRNTGVDLFNFDRSTGKLSFHRQVPVERNWLNYGVEFSDSSTAMYLTTVDWIDKSHDIYGYEVSLSVTTNDLTTSERFLGSVSSARAINRGPNGVLYIFPDGSDKLAAIEDNNDHTSALLLQDSGINFNIFSSTTTTIRRAGVLFTMGLDWEGVPYEGPVYQGEWEIPPGPIHVYDYVSSNTDGVNDFLHIDNIEFYQNAVLRIFNGQGQTVFEKENYENNWPSQRVDAGTYFYQVEFESGEVEKGSFTLVN